MKCTLYSTTSYQALQQMAYTPLGGPAFIWSAAWSADSSRLVVGCWNRHAYVYAVHQETSAAAAAASASAAASAATASAAAPSTAPGDVAASTIPPVGPLVRSPCTSLLLTVLGE